MEIKEYNKMKREKRKYIRKLIKTDPWKAREELGKAENNEVMTNSILQKLYEAIGDELVKEL